MIKCCYLLKIKTKGHKINILIQIKGIGGYPFITRFKTCFHNNLQRTCCDLCIGGYPFITRFKTQGLAQLLVLLRLHFRIGGYPFITRFKTQLLNEH